jgi:oxygen-independent coproporphyrinogen-3 oxidase
MDHFALPGDELARAQEHGGLHRNFMGYTTHADTDLVGFGVSAISRVGDSYWQAHREIVGWEAAVDAGHLPLWRGLTLQPDDRIREDVIQQLMCQGAIDVALIETRHRIDFDAYFSDALPRLEALRGDGLIDRVGANWVATDRGRLLLRIIAMCFDAYLDQPAPVPVRFSRAV